MKPTVAILVVTHDLVQRGAKLLRQICNTRLDCWKKYLIAIDNSEIESDRICWADIVARAEDLQCFTEVVLHQNRENERLGASTNRAIDIADCLDCDFLAYVCVEHSYIYNQNWLASMLTTFISEKQKDDRVVLGGTIQPVPGGTIVIPNAPMLHVQGGLFVGDVKFMKAHPYDVNKFPHSYMDVYLSQLAMMEGYKLCEIPTIRSLMVGFSHYANSKYQAAHSRELGAILDSLPGPIWHY